MRKPCKTFPNGWAIFPAFLATAAVVAVAVAVPAAAQEDRKASSPPAGAAEPQAGPSKEQPAQSQAQESAAEKSVHSKSGNMGTSEPNAHNPAAQQPDNAILVNGRLNVPGAPEDSETVPAKFSERNARLDELPIMAQPLHLTADQRRRIWDFVAGTEPSSTAFDAQPAQQLPATVELQDLPRDISGAIPEIAGYKFAHVRGKALLVQPPNRIVVGEVAEPGGPAMK